MPGGPRSASSRGWGPGLGRPSGGALARRHRHGTGRSALKIWGCPVPGPSTLVDPVRKGGDHGESHGGSLKERRHPAGKFATVIDRRYIRLGPAIRRKACQKCTGETPALLGKQAPRMSKPFSNRVWLVWFRAVGAHGETLRRFADRDRLLIHSSELVLE